MDMSVDFRKERGVELTVPLFWDHVLSVIEDPAVSTQLILLDWEEGWLIDWLIG